ncbi:hypothetical protein HDU98_006784 [Podochytrium sp. JEL0797]|nr:hypothetical protein HDU98_006784 [Podochytrium sp. JEL0797]
MPPPTNAILPSTFTSEIELVEMDKHLAHVAFTNTSRSATQNPLVGFFSSVWTAVKIGFWGSLWYTFRLIPARSWLGGPQMFGVVYLIVKNGHMNVRCIHPASLLPLEITQDHEDKSANPHLPRLDAVGNDPIDTAVGSRGQPFGRNIPKPVGDIRMDTPSTDVVADTFMTRTEFKAAETLNLFAAGWLQFFIHDLLDHVTDTTKLVTVGKQTFSPTLPIPGMPHVYQNGVDHFLNGSQLYGSSKHDSTALRNADGTMRLKDNYLPIDPVSNTEQLGLPKNIWFGLALVHYVLCLEHNSIVEKLREVHPDWSGDELFDRARLVMSALILKIQGSEWVTAIIQNKASDFGQWHMLYGIFGQSFRRRFGNLFRFLGNFASGTLGGHLQYRTAGFAMTEEFVSIYRMHQLLPETFTVKSPNCPDPKGHFSLKDAIFQGSQKTNRHWGVDDMVYSMGHNHPGSLTLNNFPTFLRDVYDASNNPRAPKIDLAAIDLIRDRERGVPRFNAFRRGYFLKPIASWKDLTRDEEVIAKLDQVYGGDVEQLDLMVGLMAEEKLPGFIFGETTHTPFVVEAQRRIECDRFLTVEYREEVYTKEGMEWVEYNTFASVLRRHFPALRDVISDSDNAFLPFKK